MKKKEEEIEAAEFLHHLKGVSNQDEFLNYIFEKIGFKHLLPPGM